jgi:hypothetical protein
VKRDRRAGQKSVKTARRDCMIEARAVRPVIAVDLLPGDFRQAIDGISRAS